MFGPKATDFGGRYECLAMVVSKFNASEQLGWK